MFLGWGYRRWSGVLLLGAEKSLQTLLGEQVDVVRADAAVAHAVPFEGELDHARSELLEANTRWLPEIKREAAGDGVDLVEVDLTGIVVDHKVDPRHARAFKQLEDAHGEILNLACLLVVEWRRDDAVERCHACRRFASLLRPAARRGPFSLAPATPHVFLLVGQQVLPLRLDGLFETARERLLRIPQHGAVDLTQRLDGVFDHDLVIVAECFLDRRIKRRAILRPRYPNR